MRLRDFLRLAGKTRDLIFVNPSSKTLRALTGLNAEYDSEVGGYVIEVKDPPQKEGSGLIFHLVEPTPRISWVSVRRVKKDWQVDAFG